MKTVIIILETLRGNYVITDAQPFYPLSKMKPHSNVLTINTTNFIFLRYIFQISLVFLHYTVKGFVMKYSYLYTESNCNRSSLSKDCQSTLIWIKLFECTIWQLVEEQRIFPLIVKSGNLRPLLPNSSSQVSNVSEGIW